MGVRRTVDEVEVVDTKGGGETLRFDHDEWTAFIAGVKAGEFDVPTT